ncbi:MAG: DUF4157 domain-containing protein [Xenococcaceae cyanobacterium MO_167.B27]|nr:DUF4157 domain-containing protein [Xenococcaceae cyanobacterium MO_167.B27]
MVARQQTAQPVNAPKSGLSDPKFNFNLSNIPISAPVQPQEEDEAEKQLQKQELQKSKLQQQPSNLPGKLSPKSGSSIHLNKMLISAPQRSFNTPPLQPKLKVRIAPRNRLQQQITEKREEEPSEELSTKAFASSSNPSDNPGQDNPESGTNRTSAMGHSLANIAISSPGTYSLPPPSPLIQPKLTISTPGDKYEQEADTVSARVVERINNPNFAAQAKAKSMVRNTNRNQHLVLRQSPLKINPSKPPKLVHPIPHSTPWIKRMTAVTTNRPKLNFHNNLEASIQRARAGGQPIEDKVREPMEQALGADFSEVKIHTDSQANELNNAIQAKAFTTGQDIFFRQGEYNPNNKEGQELLAHELTHVVQQNGGAVQPKAEPEADELSEITISETETNSLPALAAKAEPGASPGSATESNDEPGQIIEQLKNTPPTKAAKIYNQAQNTSSQALDNQKQKVQNTIPEIPAPTGLSPQEKSEENAAEELTEPKAAKTDTQSTESEDSPKSRASKKGGIVSGFNKLKNQIKTGRKNQTPTSKGEVSKEDISKVNTSAGERPKVELSGEADPAKMDQTQDQSDREVEAAKKQEVQQSKQDFGENDIFPQANEEILKTKKEFAAAKFSAKKNTQVIPVPKDLEGGLNEGLTPFYQEQIAPEQEKYRNGKNKFDLDSKQARTDADQEIANLDQEAKEKQVAEQKQAKQSVGKAREDWQTELDNVDKDYQSQAGKATKEQRKKIDDEKSKAEQEADQHLTKAEQDAEAEKNKAEEEAKKKEAEAEAEKDKPWYEKVGDFVKNAWEAFTSFVTDLFNALRNAIKAIFDAVKAVVMKVIDLARQAIVGLIEALGEILKAIVSVALAAFPEIAQKFRNAIDEITSKAVAAVNAVADFLQKAVSAVLDFLANTLDSLLSVLRDLFTGIMTLIQMIITGQIEEIIQGMANLVEGGKAMPPQFETAALEELLGGNLDEPLSPEVIAQAQQAGIEIPNAKGGSMQPGLEVGEMPQAPWTKDNVGVDGVEQNMELSPEVMAELMQQTNGNGEVMLGESNDSSRSMESIISEAGGQQQTKGGEEKQQYPDDGLSPKQRAEIKWELMKQGIQKWFSDNWPILLAGLIAAGVVIVGAIVLSGGAVLAALPVIMQVLTVVFAAELIAMMAGHMRDYVTKAWAGDIQGGGKSLAKAFAAGAIELAFAIIPYLGKALKKGAKAVTKGAKAAFKGGAKVAARAGKAVAKGAKYTIQKGKVVFKGIAGTKFGKQFKTLSNLGQGLLNKMRFKGFRIRVKNRRFRLEGLINPWVLIAEGNITQVAEGAEGAIKLSDEQLKVVEKLSPDARQALSELKQEQVDQLTKLLKEDPSNAEDILKQYFYKAKKSNAELPDDVASKLQESLDNFKVVKERGYPYGFENIDDFLSFKKELNSALARYNIPTDNIRIHGSAVHKTTPGDLDVAIIVDEKQFQELGARFIANSRLDKIKTQITKELAKGKIPSYRFSPRRGNTVAQSVYGKAGNLEKIQVSLIRQGSQFDIGPYLSF